MLIAETSEPLQLGMIAMGLAGGLALFLFGMDQMSDALKFVAGNGLKKVLAKLTSNRFTAAFAGAFVTAVIQSSSVTTVLVVGFISAGLMSLSQSVGIIMGANVGTTVTAQIIAFKVTKYSLLLIAAGFALLFATRNEKLRQYGHMIMGLGLIFFGMQMMSEATLPLRDYGPFKDLMAQMANPFYGILLAAAFTALVQSSSATTGLVIALAMNGNISLEAGIALIFGANIGTCITAILAAIGKPREAVRAAAIHVLFNVAGVVVWFAFIPQLAELVTWVSPSAPELAGAERLAAETPRQIANAHTIFNVANTLIFIGLTTPMAALVCRLIPDRVEEKKTDVVKPKYLDDILLRTPSLAMDIVRMELGRLGAAALHMVRGGLRTAIHGSANDLQSLEDMDNEVDQLHAAIVTYLGRLSKENLTNDQSKQLQDYLSVANYLENIGDMIEINVVEAGRDRLKHQLTVSQATEQILDELHRKVCWAVDRSIRALVSNDLEAANEVMLAKDEINNLVSQAEEHLTFRLGADEENRLATFRLESELIEYLKRMYYFAKRIGKLVTNGTTTAKPDAEEVSESDEPVPT